MPHINARDVVLYDCVDAGRVCNEWKDHSAGSTAVQ